MSVVMNGYVLGFLKLDAATPGCKDGAGASVISVEMVYILIFLLLVIFKSYAAKY